MIMLDKFYDNYLYKKKRIINIAPKTLLLDYFIKNNVKKFKTILPHSHLHSLKIQIAPPGH
jgi:hypothetical protein